MPKISLIIPIYNSEKYLKKCLESAINQTLLDIEILCLDNCSYDSSLLILKEYQKKDSRIKVFELAENKGAACARNMGIKAARGEFIGFIDSDDWIDLDFLEKLYKKANSSGAEVVIAGQNTVWSDYVHEDNETIPLVKENKYNFNMIFPKAIYKKSMLDKYNIRFLEGLNWGEDRLFVIQACYYSDMVETQNDTHYNYYRHDDAATSNVDIKKINSMLCASKKIFDFINGSKIKDDKESYTILAIEFLNDIIRTFKRLPQEENTDFSEIFSKIALIFENVKYDIVKNNYCYSYVLKAIKDNNLDIFNFLTDMCRFDVQRFFYKIKDYNSPKISVIIPVYNVEKYLKKCLDSVINQTLKDIEIICVNDCSTDNCGEILKEYARRDKRVKIIDFKENQGVARARNEGIKAACGEYVGFVDSDDYVSLDFYEKLYLKAKNENADVVKGCFFNVLPDGKILKEGWALPLSQKTRDNIIYFNTAFWSAIYERKFLSDNDIKFIDGCVWGEDRLFPIKAVYYSKKIVLDFQSAYCYIYASDSVTKKINEKKLNSAVLSNESVFNFINSNDFSKEDYIILAKEFLLDVIYCLRRSLKEAQIGDYTLIIKRIANIINSIKYPEVIDEINYGDICDSILKGDLKDFCVACNETDRAVQRKLIQQLRNNHLKELQKA